MLGACQIFRTELARAAGPFADWIFLGPDDADWCFRLRDAGGEVVYFPEATVVHTYRRRTAVSPLSRTALRSAARLRGLPMALPEAQAGDAGVAGGPAPPPGSMSGRPEVSVVVVTLPCPRAPSLQCLESLQQHAGIEYEAIIVDDGSGRWHRRGGAGAVSGRPG